MQACRRIRPRLEWLAADELGDEPRRQAEAHLRACPDCRRELASWRSLLAAAARPAAAAAAEVQGVEWDKVTARILAGAGERALPARRTAPLPRFAFLAAAAALVAVIGLGVFFLTRARGVTMPRDGGGPLVEDLQGRLSVPVAAHLQAGLAREGMRSYLQQSQLLLTDLLQDCAGDDTQAWEINLYSRQAKELLLKKKYFRQNLPAADWLKVRNISERIDWLNYEILQLRGDQFCGQVDRLQRIMERENILLKLRLLEKDLAAGAYQEV